jgi:hypothetical protein
MSQGRHIPTDVADRVRADREAGLSYSQIGKRYGIAAMSAKRIVTGRLAALCASDREGPLRLRPASPCPR